MLVSVPYEITLLSNANIVNTKPEEVSVPYEITLLSNEVAIVLVNGDGFSTL